MSALSQIAPVVTPLPAAKQLLTHSRMASMRRCLREHWYRYELGITKDAEAKYFKVGHAVHKGLETWHSTKDPDKTVAAITGENQLDDPYDQVTVLVLLDAYIDHTLPLEFVAAEQQFELPLINPETGAASRTFNVAGKIDGLTDDAVVEHKSTSEDISPDSDYWLRLRVDPQISLYALASGKNKVLYNVVRKPSIRPRQIPETDADGIKICVDDNTGERVQNKNGSWKQAAAEGCHLVTRDETPEEFGERLREDIRSRPDFYFARREIPILDDHLEEFKQEVWQQAKALMDCQKHGRWFRNVSRTTCGNCQYANLCLQSIQVGFNPDGSVQVPSGYIKSEPHKELFNAEVAA